MRVLPLRRAKRAAGQRKKAVYGNCSAFSARGYMMLEMEAGQSLRPEYSRQCTRGFECGTRSHAHAHAGARRRRMLCCIDVLPLAN